MARLTDAAEPAAHIEVVESAGAEYEAVTGPTARRRRRFIAIRLAAAVVAVPVAVLVMANAATQSGWAVALGWPIGGLAAIGAIYWAVNGETFRAARRGLWSKSCSVVVEAQAEEATNAGYLVLRPSGVYVQTVIFGGFRARFRTAHSFPWSSLNSVEFVQRGNRWRLVVISGPGVRIAPIGSVNAGFAETLVHLGAVVPDR